MMIFGMKIEATSEELSDTRIPRDMEHILDIEN